LERLLALARRDSSVPSGSSGDSEQSRIPIGIVLLIVGAIVLVTAAGSLLISPLKVPDQLKLANVPPTAVNAVQVTVTSNGEGGSAEAPVLLPESPPLSRQLPSFASVENAPRLDDNVIANQPQRLEIPSLNVDVAIRRVGLVPVSSGGRMFFQWAVPSGYEVGWHESSAPLGTPGNTVLNGHNNIYGEVFRDLIDLSVGEEIIVHDSEGARVYQVEQQELLAENGQPLSVRLENARWIEPTSDERVTLVSCWPYATNSHRLIVVARPVSHMG
jgi:LPXTG-site transpeptidase (sortase) family protein